MLDKAKTLKGYKLNSLDGEIGSVKQFYFDDQHWTIRYLIADTGNWLSGREVLLSPYALEGVDTSRKQIDVNLTKKQIEGSPSLDTDKPVSRQFEEAYNGYYEQPSYWNGPFMWGSYPYIERDRARWADVAAGRGTGDPHLRSTKTVTDYHIEATDGDIGHVEDFVIDDETWAIRYLVVNTRNWWPGKKVLISPQWIDRVSWTDSRVYVSVSRETIKNAVEYSDETLITRSYESSLYKNYNRRGYWEREPVGV